MEPGWCEATCKYGGLLRPRAADQTGHEVRTVIVDPDRGPHITWAFTTYATGTWSITQLVNALTARGVTSRPGPTTPAHPLTLRAVHQLLHNPYYKGVVTLNGVEHPGTHPVLVDPVTWARVQDVLTARRSGERTRVHEHYLKSTVYCIDCGRRLIIQSTQGKNGHRYEYFVCHRRQHPTCPQRKALPVADVEQRVADCYRTLTPTPTQRTRIEHVALAQLRRQHDATTQRLADLAAQAELTEQHRTKLLDAYYADAIPRDLFLTEQRRLKNEHARIDREQAAARRDSADLEQRAHDALDLLQNAHATYQHADDITRKQLNQTLFARILLGHPHDQIRIELNEPYNTLTSGNTPQNN